MAASGISAVGKLPLPIITASGAKDVVIRKFCIAVSFEWELWEKWDG